MRSPPKCNKRHSGFTLIELLVVIAIITLLAGILLPALNRSKVKAQAALCMSNHRQLLFALHLYAGDQEDRLPYNFGASGTRQTVAEKRYLNWINNVMSWELDSDNTNTLLLKEGGLGPYCSAAVNVFKCPADRALSDIQKKAGWTKRVRSVSMNAMLGYAGEFMRGSVNTNNPEYQQYFKLSDVRQPSAIFSFVEEHPDSVNDGYFLNRLESLEWVDLPASYHDGAANLSFPDGHAESHRWLFPRTKPPPRPDAARLPLPVPASERTDYDWLAKRTAASRLDAQTD